MTITPEIEPQQIHPTPEVPVQQGEPPKETQPVEERGASQTPSQVVSQVVQDNNIQPVATSPTPQTVTITIPATTQQLDDWSKGSPDNSLTWLAFYWIRMIKKALFHGYRVITQGSQQSQYA